MMIPYSLFHDYACYCKMVIFYPLLYVFFLHGCEQFSRPEILF